MQRCFRENSFIVKLTTFSTAKETKSETKPVNVSERSRWTVFLVLLISAVICVKRLCMETRLFNTFKTTNATRLSKTTVESSLKVLSGTFSLNSLKQPVYNLRAIEFRATFNV